MTPEQQKLMEQYQYVPIWLLTKKLTVESPLVRQLIHKFGSLEDVVSELYLPLIKAIKSYNPDRGASLKTWIINVCYLSLKNLARLSNQDSCELSFKTNSEIVAVQKFDKEEILIPFHILSKQQADVLKRRFKENKETLDQISKDYNVTRERVRQIERKAITRLKEWYSNENNRL